MQGKQLLNEASFDRIKPNGAAYQLAADSDGGAENSEGVDCGDCDGVVFMFAAGAIAATGTIAVKAQQSDDDGDDDDYDDIEGSEQNLIGTSDNKVVLLEIYRPAKRYVRIVTTRATDDSAIDGLFVIKHGQRVHPVEQGAKVLASEILYSPEEGTA